MNTTTNLKLKKHTLLLIASDGYQVGKTTFAASLESYLEKETMLRESFAEPIKDMLRTLLTRHLGANYTDVSKGLTGDLKETQVAALKHSKVTYRKLMQTLGTEWREAAGCPDLWSEVMLNKLLTRAEWADNQDKKIWVAVDDFRFPREAAFLMEHLDAEEWEVETVMISKSGAKNCLEHKSGGSLKDWLFDYFIVMISKLGAKNCLEHKSEGSLKDWVFDYFIDNSGTKAQLYSKAADTAYDIIVKQNQ